VVLCHGLGGSARNWRPQLRALRPRWRAIAYDARGHARSQAPASPGAYSIERLVADLARVLDAHAGGPAAAVGLSLGAAVALHFALAHPERVRGLVLASFPAPRAAGGFAAVALEFAAAIERDGLEAAGARYVWGETSGLDAQGAASVRAGFMEHAPHGIAGLLREAVAAQPEVEALAPRLVALDLPALVVAGAADRGSLGAARALAAALPRARLEVIEGAGHVVNLARPDAFNRLLLGFLDEIGLPA
jgi:3-oxoadipate enol-lactonase